MGLAGGTASSRAAGRMAAQAAGGVAAKAAAHAATCGAAGAERGSWSSAGKRWAAWQPAARAGQQAPRPGGSTSMHAGNIPQSPRPPASLPSSTTHPPHPTHPPTPARPDPPTHPLCLRPCRCRRAGRQRQGGPRQDQDHGDQRDPHEQALPQVPHQEVPEEGGRQCSASAVRQCGGSTASGSGSTVSGSGSTAGQKQCGSAGVQGGSAQAAQQQGSSRTELQAWEHLRGRLCMGRRRGCSLGLGGWQPRAWQAIQAAQLCPACWLVPSSCWSPASHPVRPCPSPAALQHNVRDWLRVIASNKDRNGELGSSSGPQNSWRDPQREPALCCWHQVASSVPRLAAR